MIRDVKVFSFLCTHVNFLFDLLPLFTATLFWALAHCFSMHKMRTTTCAPHRPITTTCAPCRPIRHHRASLYSVIQHPSYSVLVQLPCLSSSSSSTVTVYWVQSFLPPPVSVTSAKTLLIVGLWKVNCCCIFNLRSELWSELLHIVAYLFLFLFLVFPLSLSNKLYVCFSCLLLILITAQHETLPSTRGWYHSNNPLFCS